MKSRTLSIEIDLDFHPLEWWVPGSVYVMLPGTLYDNPPLRASNAWMVAIHFLCFTATVGRPF